MELDDLSPVDDLVKHTSSAVDIRTVLMQIKTFWAQLCWPDVESSYAYISKILDVSRTFEIFTLNFVHFIDIFYNLLPPVLERKYLLLLQLEASNVTLSQTDPIS